MNREEVFKYIEEKYGVEPEYLWHDTPDAAIFRHENNRKWFALIMKVNDEEYLNVKTDPDYSDLLRNTYDYIIPAYHMNKEYWNTIIISQNANKALVYELIDQSYELTKKKQKRISKKPATGQDMKQKVYEYLLTIPKGKVATYSQIAEHLGNKKLCRVVGNILHNNPDPIKYPCYKVVNSKGELSKNFGDAGIDVQKQRLVADGIEVVNYKVDLEKYRIQIERV